MLTIRQQGVELGCQLDCSPVWLEEIGSRHTLPTKKLYVSTPLFSSHIIAIEDSLELDMSPKGSLTSKKKRIPLKLGCAMSGQKYSSIYIGKPWMRSDANDGRRRGGADVIS